MIKTVSKIFLTVMLLCGTVFAADSIKQVRASHILVKTRPEAIQIKKDIENGGDFAYYAETYSLCPSGKNGGDLGYFSRGQMVQPFEDVALIPRFGFRNGRENRKNNQKLYIGLKKLRNYLCKKKFYYWAVRIFRFHQ